MRPRRASQLCTDPQPGRCSRCDLVGLVEDLEVVTVIAERDPVLDEREGFLTGRERHHESSEVINAVCHFLPPGSGGKCFTV